DRGHPAPAGGDGETRLGATGRRAGIPHRWAQDAGRSGQADPHARGSGGAVHVAGEFGGQDGPAARGVLVGGGGPRRRAAARPHVLRSRRRNGSGEGTARGADLRAGRPAGTAWIELTGVPVSNVNDANFGVLFVVDEAGVNNVTLQVDFVSITVW